MKINWEEPEYDYRANIRGHVYTIKQTTETYVLHYHKLGFIIGGGAKRELISVHKSLSAAKAAASKHFKKLNGK